MKHYRLKIEDCFLVITCCVLFSFTLQSCGSCTSGNKRLETDDVLSLDSPRIEDSKSIANRYSEIKKEFNELEIVIDTLKYDLSDERFKVLKDKLLQLQLESKNLTTDFEANKISNEQNEDLLKQGINYIALADLTDKLIRVLGNLETKIDNIRRAETYERELKKENATSEIY